MARLTPSEPLTPRQREVWRLIGRGHTNSEIANLLGISLAGAKWHVSELLGKFNAASREELAEAWHEGGIVSRMSGWAGGLLASVSLKTGLAVGATVVGVSGAAFAGAVVWSLADSSGTRATPVDVASVPTASGAKWTPQQAYDVARRQAGIALASAQLSQIDPSVRLDQMTLAALDWLPGITRWDAPDGDRYWQSGISTPLDIWHFEWSLDGVRREGGTPADSGELYVELLIQDGSATRPPATRVQIVDSAGTPIAGISGFGSHKQDVSRDTLLAPVGDVVPVALLDGAGPGAISVYDTAADVWCWRESEGSVGCPAAPALQPLEISIGPVGIAEMPTRLTVLAWDSVNAISITSPTGVTTTVPTFAPPAGVAPGVRFAYVTLPPEHGQAIVVGLSASGTEIGRQAVGY